MKSFFVILNIALKTHIPRLLLVGSLWIRCELGKRSEINHHPKAALCCFRPPVEPEQRACGLYRLFSAKTASKPVAFEGRRAYAGSSVEFHPLLSLEEQRCPWPVKVRLKSSSSLQFSRVISLASSLTKDDSVFFNLISLKEVRNKIEISLK